MRLRPLPRTCAHCRQRPQRRLAILRHGRWGAQPPDADAIVIRGGGHKGVVRVDAEVRDVAGVAAAGAQQEARLRRPHLHQEVVRARDNKSARPVKRDAVYRAAVPAECTLVLDADKTVSAAPVSSSQHNKSAPARLSSYRCRVLSSSLCA